MDANEEPVPVPLMPSTVPSKELVHRKLLETIYEAPKHGRDGTEQLTSIRKYRRFIDFTEATSAAKKWKRTQKALKLASTRRVAEDACEEQLNGDAPARRVRHSTRHKPETAPNDRDSLVISRCRRSNNARRKAIEQEEPAVHTDDVCSSGTPKQEFSVIVVENGDMPVEEGATVELPYEMIECSVLDTAFIDDGIESEVQESVARMLMTVDAQASDGGVETSIGSSRGNHVKVAAEPTAPEEDTLGCGEIWGVDANARLRPLTETVKTRKRKAECFKGDDVASAVGDLAAIVDTTCFLCEVSSTVADHCSTVDCDTIDAAQVLCRVIENVSSEMSQQE